LKGAGFSIARGELKVHAKRNTFVYENVDKPDSRILPSMPVKNY
jgi:hypothetical protein